MRRRLLAAAALLGVNLTMPAFAQASGGSAGEDPPMQSEVIHVQPTAGQSSAPAQSPVVGSGGGAPQASGSTANTPMPNVIRP